MEACSLGGRSVHLHKVGTRDACRDSGKVCKLSISTGRSFSHGGFDGGFEFGLVAAAEDNVIFSRGDKDVLDSLEFLRV